LHDFRPDLIQDVGRTGNLGRSKQNQVQTKYMQDEGYVALAGIRRHGRTIHFYFGRPDSPLFEETARRLRSIPGVEYVALQGNIHIPGIAIHPLAPVPRDQD